MHSYIGLDKYCECLQSVLGPGSRVHVIWYCRGLNTNFVGLYMCYRGCIGFRDNTPVVQNQVEKKIEHERELDVCWACVGIFT